MAMCIVDYEVWVSSVLIEKSLLQKKHLFLLSQLISAGFSPYQALHEILQLGKVFAILLFFSEKEFCDFFYFFYFVFI